MASGPSGPHQVAELFLSTCLTQGLGVGQGGPWPVDKSRVRWVASGRHCCWDGLRVPVSPPAGRASTVPFLTQDGPLTPASCQLAPLPSASSAHQALWARVSPVRGISGRRRTAGSVVSVW